MLTHPEAVQLIRNARQPNVANPWRSVRDFEHIIQDFFAPQIEAGELKDSLICDLGPGQYDMLRFFRDAGGICTGIDNDPAVIAVGNCLGFEVIELDMKKPNAFQLGRSFDGIFCKFSINAFWFPSPEALSKQITDLCSQLSDSGWGWIAPWNGIPKAITDKKFVKQMLEAQKEAFESHGWECRNLKNAEITHYGVNGKVANNRLFTKKPLTHDTRSK